MAGSTTFPTSVDNKAQLTDGVDIIQADDVNDAYVPIDAIESFVGVSGAAQSHNTDILAQLFALKPTIKLSYSNATTVVASAGVSKTLNSGATIRKMRKNTSTTNITGSNLDAGGPSFAVSTTYYVYSSGDAAASTAVFVVSTNGSAPSGVIHYELIGGFATDGSGNIIESTVWSVAGMQVIQVKNFQTGEVATGTTVFPFDDTIPQSGEGDQYMSLTITPKSTTNKLKIEVVVVGSLDTNNESFGAAIFQDSTANALACAACPGHPSGGDMGTLKFTHFMAAGTISATTFKVRAGFIVGTGTFTFNGSGGARKFGGVLVSSITITEYE